MQTTNILTNESVSLPDGRADFLLVASALTLDAEYLTNEKVFSADKLTQTAEGLPSPVLITRAVYNLAAFSTIEILDLGLQTQPQNTIVHHFKLSSLSADESFKRGMQFGKSYELKGNYLILGESSPSSITTATASILALGYNPKDFFAPALLNKRALALSKESISNFEKLNQFGDTMLLFCAGFLIEASKRFQIVLSGGIQMTAVLLIADALREDILMRANHNNIILSMTHWTLQNGQADPRGLLSLLSYTPKTLCATVSFENSEIPALKQYDINEFNEEAGAGAALAYAERHGISDKELLEQIEILYYCL